MTKKIKYNVRLKVFFLFTILSIAPAVYSSNNSDSLLRLVYSCKIDTTKIRLWNQLAFNFRNNNTVLAEKYLDSAINLSKKNNYKRGFYDTFTLLAIFEKNKGNFQSSLDYSLKALKYAEESGNRNKISSIQNNIGSVYQALGNTNQAMKYYKLSLLYENETGNKANRSIRLYNIGAVYEMMDSLNLSSDYYFHSLQIEEERQNPEGIFYALTGLSGVNTRMKKYQIASGFLDRALEIATKSNNKSGILITLLEQGNLFKEISKPKESIYCYKKALEFADSLGFRKEKLVALENLANLYKQSNEFNIAFNYQEQYLFLKDSIGSVDIQNKISDLQSKYEYEKKDNIIKLLMKEKELRKIELVHRNKTIYYFLTFGFIFLFIFAYKAYENKSSSPVSESKRNIAVLLFIDKPTLKVSVIISGVAGLYFYIYALIFEPFNYAAVTKSVFIFPLVYLIIIAVIVALCLHLIELWNNYFRNGKSHYLKYIAIPFFAILLISILIWCYNSMFQIAPLKLKYLTDVFSEITLVFIFPFIIIILFAESFFSKLYQNNAEILFEKIESNQEVPAKDETLTIAPEKGKNELKLLQENLLYIKSEDNYCEVMYWQNNKVKKEVMRVTMKAMEEQVKPFLCMIRCHKSYIVNTTHIEKISGNSLGYKLHIKITGTEIPVSRSFPKEILATIKSNLD